MKTATIYSIYTNQIITSFKFDKWIFAVGTNCTKFYLNDKLVAMVPEERVIIIITDL